MATVKFYLETPKKDGVLRKDEVTIVARFTVSRDQRFQKKTQQKIEPKFWNSTNQCVKSNHRDHHSINDYLADFKRHLTNLYRDNWQLSFEEFKTLALAARVQKKTLAQAFRQWLTHCRREKDEKTLKSYVTLLRDLREYKINRRIRLDFDHIDWNFYDSFRNMLYSRGNVDVTVNKTIARFTAVLRWATKRGFPVDPVFEQWPKPKKQKETPVKLLTMSELLTLEAATNLTREESIGRDFLCLESRTGQRISDLIRFDVANYENYQWTFYRKKGSNIKSKLVTVHFVGFCEPALYILAKHNFKLPRVAEQTINRWIKAACERVGMTYLVAVPVWRHGKRTIEMQRKCDVMSTHAGRRSFITLALQFLPPKVVMDLAGIDSYQTLKPYEGNSETNIIQSHLTSMQQQLKAV